MSLRREPDEAISYGVYRAMVEQRNETQAEVERLREERQMVLDCINLYGDETLHGALDDIGWVPRARGEKGA